MDEALAVQLHERLHSLFTLEHRLLDEIRGLGRLLLTVTDDAAAAPYVMAARLAAEEVTAHAQQLTERGPAPREARPAALPEHPAWLRELLDDLTGESRDTSADDPPRTDED